MTTPTPQHQLLRRAVPTLRVELADAATRGRVATSEDVAAVIAGSDPDAALEALTLACAERGEPDLASLVLRREDGAPDPLAGDRDGLRLNAELAAQRAGERRRCWRHWGGEAAESAGLALAQR